MVCFLLKFCAVLRCGSGCVLDRVRARSTKVLADERIHGVVDPRRGPSLQGLRSPTAAGERDVVLHVPTCCGVLLRVRFGHGLAERRYDEHGSDVAVDITVTNDATGVAYNVSATVTSGPTYSVETAVNYTATWKAYLRPAPVGGSYSIAAACSGAGCGGALPVSTIRRVTMGDVYFCSGQVWCGFCDSFSSYAVVACVVSTVALSARHPPCEGDADHLHCATRDRETFRSYFSA